MKIIFGLELDDLVIPQEKTIEGGTHYFGPTSLLFMLESHLGLIGHPTNNEYLRIEQYRQALLKHLTLEESPFYKISFEADQFATATELLSRRDELLLAGWGFEKVEKMPFRLKTLAEIEQIFKEIPPEEETNLTLSPGFADRFVAVLANLEKRKHPIEALFLNEPLELLPFHFQNLFKAFQVKISTLAITKNPNDKSDLANFQHRLLAPSGKKDKLELQNDGSLLLLKSKRACDAASYLAKIFKHNADYRPACLIPEKNRALDIALIQEGMPSLGILSASLARPTLQILKLVPAFLWQPIDPFKILEFVSLSVKPLEDGLATAIANQMARTPGLNGEGWHITINRYFENLHERAATDPNIKVGEIKRQYEFWFERRRYNMDGEVPKSEVLKIFDYLQNWAFTIFDDSGGKNNSFLVLSEQCKRIVELLETLPELELTYLELERIVRTIYEPSPVVFQEREIGHLPYVMHTSAVIGAVDSLVWWNFVQNEPVHFFSRWYQKERNYLCNLEHELETPERENALLLWQRSRPVLNAQNRLLLILPEMVNGSTAHPHPLFGDLEAAFENLEDITLNIDTQKGKANFENHLTLPGFVEILPRQLGNPKPFLHVRNLDKLSREQETLTSLETLFYFPYQWVFKYKIRLNKSSILSVVKDNTLMGNLAHRMFEKLFNEPITNWDKPQVEQWIEKQAPNLLKREGAVLLMYGREPERIAFINKLKYAAWSLVAQVQENDWEVKGTEIDLNGKFQGIPIKGRADLVLKRGEEQAILDLKWRGAARREGIIKNEEDLQLVLYSKLLTDDDSWAHTSYFIMENGKMLARTNHAFKDITPIAPDVDFQEINNRILDKMNATFSWRMEQLKKGQIEIRCKQTGFALEDVYAESEDTNLMMEILEMKEGDAPFDDYRTLINLVE